MKRIWVFFMVLLVMVALCACAAQLPAEKAPVDSSPVDSSPVDSSPVDLPSTTESRIPSSSQPSDSSAPGSTSSVVNPTGSATAWISADAAKQIALNHAKLSSDAISHYRFERDVEDGVPQYEIEFMAVGDAYDYDIHGIKGTILKAEKNDKNILVSNTDSSFITAEQAKSAAFSHAGVSSVAVKRLRVELDKTDAVAHYEVEFVAERYEYEYDVHAQTGAIIQFEKELAD